MRVAIGAILHETNTFSPVPTPLEAFDQPPLGILRGPAVAALRGTRTALGGFYEVADAAGWEVVPTVSAHAMPSATVTAEAHDALKAALLEPLRAAGSQPLDGVLLDLHGAMVAANAPDAETDLCRAVRAVIGPDIPLVVELDLHGNITPEFCALVDAVFGYDTNPHVDAYERGVEAAECLARILAGELPRPRVAIAKPPLLLPTINMRTAEGPMRALLERGREWEAGAGIVNVSVFGGFPYADFPGAGAAIVVTATDPTLGQRCADNLGRLAWELREQFLKPIPAVEEAVEQALRLLKTPGERPVILADVADNPGGGGSGDTTALLRELLRRGARGAAACVWDPAAVERALALGIGAEGEFAIGGRAMPEAYGAPLAVRGRVTHLSDGRFTGWGPLMRGQAADCGPTACIDVAGLQLVVTTRREAANDRGYFQVAGVQPEREPLLVIKSRGHFRADFEPIARAIIEVDAPGAANPNLARYTYRNLGRAMWPVDASAAWVDGDARRVL